MKAKIFPTVALGIVCLAVAAMLAIINSFTEPRIEQNKIDALNASLAEVLDGHSDFTDIKLTKDLPSSIKLVKKSKEGGYVFNVVVNGKSEGLTILIGITPDGKIAGTKCTSTNETPSYAEPVFGKTENGYYVGMDSETLDVYLVAGSTLTSKAYGKAVSDALDAFAILEGGNS